jgi:pimeloyl-ACP methyl ester carboxylesterase
LILIQAIVSTAAADVSTSSERSYQEKPVHFVSNGKRIAGVLCLPESKGPFPVVLFVAGSGATGRYGSGAGTRRALWEAFARRGIASLGWDKPGVGESEGDWRNQTMDDRAREVVAAIEFLKAQQAIDPRGIALWGASQAGWVMPRVYELASNDVRLIICVSGPVGTGAEQELYRVRHGMPADGFSSEETQAAVQFTEKRIALLDRSAPFEEVAGLQRVLEGKSWREFVGVLDPKGYEFLKGGSSTVEPGSFLVGIRCPLLAIFGAKDTIVDSAQSAEVYQRVLNRAGNTNVTVITFQNADHAIFTSKTGGMKELLESFKEPEKHYAPGFVDTMAGWLEKNFGRIRSEP